MELVTQLGRFGQPQQVYVYPIETCAAWLGLWIAIALGGLWIGSRGGVQFPSGTVPPATGYICAGFMLLFVWIQWLDLRARLRPSNWLARLHDAGLLVQLRSYRNFHFPDRGPTTVFVPYADIVSARGVRVRETVPGSDRYERIERRRRTVELELTTDVMGRSEVIRALEAERQARPGWRVNHYPVRLHAEGPLEIDWEVMPRMDAFLVSLAGRTKILSELESVVDFTRITRLDSEAQRQRLAELLERGDELSAIKLVREIYGFDLMRAKAFVEEIKQTRR
jgi:hypothetical protein